jgi:cysteine desulfurase
MLRIYMDANATTPLLPAVLEAMLPHLGERFGNASAVHSYGRGAKGAIESAREQLADLLHAKASQITFTSGGTESDNLALFGLLQPGDHLVVSTVEHDAVLHAADAIARTGVTVTRVACDANSAVQPDAVAAAINPQTKLVSVMLANNETGAVQPVAAIAKIAHAAGAWLHTDAVQGCGKLPIDVATLGCDLLSVSSHKMHGPQGVGALWVRGGVPIKPILHGGSHERRRRAGTENVAGIVGLGHAAKLAKQWMADGGPAALAVLRDRLEGGLKDRLTGVCVNAASVQRLCGTASVRFDGINAEELVIALDLQGLAVSAGSACQSGATDSSHVLRAMGLTDTEARASIRFSLSRMSTEQDVDTALAMVTECVGRMRSL